MKISSTSYRGNFNFNHGTYNRRKSVTLSNIINIYHLSLLSLCIYIEVKDCIYSIYVRKLVTLLSMENLLYILFCPPDSFSRKVRYLFFSSVLSIIKNIDNLCRGRGGWPPMWISPEKRGGSALKDERRASGRHSYFNNRENCWREKILEFLWQLQRNLTLWKNYVLTSLCVCLSKTSECLLLLLYHKEYFKFLLKFFQCFIIFH